MKKAFLIFVLFFQFSSLIAQEQIDIDGVIIPRRLKFENSTIELNGIGNRSKLWMDLYTQALYLTNLSQDPIEIMNSQTKMAVRLQITSSVVSSKRLTNAINDGFERSSPEILPSLVTRIEQLKLLLKDEIVKGDVYNLFYNPNDTSIWFYKNDVLKGKIPGMDFKKAFFGIWLSDKPVSERLKNDLLGK